MPLKKRKVATHGNAPLVHSIPANSGVRGSQLGAGPLFGGPPPDGGPFGRGPRPRPRPRGRSGRAATGTIRANPRGRRRRLGCSRGRASTCLTRSSNSASHSSMGRLIWGRGARGSSGQMRGRSGRTASGGGSASVGSGPTAISGGSSDICRNLNRGLLAGRLVDRPNGQEPAAEPLERRYHGGAQHGDQQQISHGSKAVVHEGGSQIEGPESAQQGRQSDPRRPAQGRRSGGNQQRPFPEVQEDAVGEAGGTTVQGERRDGLAG